MLIFFFKFHWYLLKYKSNSTLAFINVVALKWQGEKHPIYTLHFATVGLVGEVGGQKMTEYSGSIPGGTHVVPKMSSRQQFQDVQNFD